MSTHYSTSLVTLPKLSYGSIEASKDSRQDPRQESNHFFTEAPVLTWFQWITRRIWPGPSQEPSLLIPVNPESFNRLPQLPTGMLAQLAKASSSQEYSSFLSTHFYPVSSNVQLCIAPSVFQKGIEENYLVGVEIRDSKKELVGVVFCFYAGRYKEEKMGLITWHCVHPIWRKKGLSNCLLRSIYKATQPRTIYWFRNDGWLQSIVPPIWTQTRMHRKKIQNRVSGLIHSSKKICRVPYEKWQEQIKKQWIQTNKDGIILDDIQFKQRFTEVWEYKSEKNVYYVLVIQPTFEQAKNRTPSSIKEHWCEVITWLCYGAIKSEYENAHSIETILDSLPYTWFDAPDSMPHLESSWTLSGQSSWCAFGLDTGVPVIRPLLPLCVC